LISGTYAVWQVIVFNDDQLGSLINVDSMVLSFTIALLGLGMVIARARMARDSDKAKAD
jgi:hypothetical protein